MSVEPKGEGGKASPASTGFDLYAHKAGLPRVFTSSDRRESLSTARCSPALHPLSQRGPTTDPIYRLLALTALKPYSERECGRAGQRALLCLCVCVYLVAWDMAATIGAACSLSRIQSLIRTALDGLGVSLAQREIPCPY